MLMFECRIFLTPPWGCQTPLMGSHDTRNFEHSRNSGSNQYPEELSKKSTATIKMPQSQCIHALPEQILQRMLGQLA